MTPIRNEKHEIIGYQQEQSDGRVSLRATDGEPPGVRIVAA
jgi:hypothetical protein